jgi:hypothetical protein
MRATIAAALLVPALALGFAGAATAASPFDRKGFETFEVDGRLWVFRDFAVELSQYEKGQEVEKHVTKVGAGPDGRTVKAPDVETILSYLAARDGFQTAVVGQRVWVFRDGSPALHDFLGTLDLKAKVERAGAGPFGTAVAAPDEDTITAYLAARRE